MVTRGKIVKNVEEEEEEVWVWKLIENLAGETFIVLLDVLEECSIVV